MRDGPGRKEKVSAMIDWIITQSVKNRFFVIIITAAVILGGLWALFNTPVDAIPDLSDVQVIIYTDYPGQAPQVVEDQVTYPLTTAMLAVPYAKDVRGYSFFGFSMVYIIFEDGTDLYWARSRVLEKERGLKGVRLFVSDKCLGLVESLGEFYPDAAWQRCVVHWYRNVLSAVPKGKSKRVAAMLKAIHAQEDREAARKKAADVVAKLESMRLGKAATAVRDGVGETLSYMSFPPEHWRQIRTNNMLERVMREIRRRTRVVGTFPDGRSALMLVAARLRHIAGTRWGTRRYLDMARLKEQDQEEQATKEESLTATG